MSQQKTGVLYLGKDVGDVMDPVTVFSKLGYL